MVVTWGWRAYYPPATRNGKVLCLYAYISGKPPTLPCTLTRRFPIFRPKLSTEKPRPSDPRARTRTHVYRYTHTYILRSSRRSFARPRFPAASSHHPPFLSAGYTPLTRGNVCNVEPSYSDKIERIPPKRVRLRHPPYPFPSMCTLSTVFPILPSPLPAISAATAAAEPSIDAVEIFIISHQSRVHPPSFPRLRINAAADVPNCDRDSFSALFRGCARGGL